MKARETLLALASATAFSACDRTPPESSTEPVGALGPGEVAIVDGERIPESVFRVYTLNALQSDADDLTEEGRAEIIERLVYLRVLADEAEREGLHQERRIAAELELQRLQTLARYATERFTENNPPTEAELRDLYALNLPRLQAPEYKVRHILVDTEAEATGLLTQLDSGADFAELASEHSTDSANAQNGGDLGWSAADGWIEPFAEAVQAATPGTVVDHPVETRYGWHVILVEDREEQVAPGLEAVRQDLLVAAENQKLDEYAVGLRETAEVVVVSE